VFFIREPFFWLLGCAIIGLYIGRPKGMPRQGFFLGLFLGPIGWGIMAMLPGAKTQGQPGPRASVGPACPRCRRPVGAGDKACAHCGNVLVPVSYRVVDG
jgi:hypothetical protein